MRVRSRRRRGRRLARLYGGEDSPCDITRGLFAGEIGIPRMLKLFDRYGIQTTWFIPGHSIETFPKQMQMVADAGHEIGLHGYSHENPVAMTPEQEEAVLEKSIELIDGVRRGASARATSPPGGSWRGHRRRCCSRTASSTTTAGWTTTSTPSTPASATPGPRSTTPRPAETWMKPLVRGEETDLVEIGANWYVDDLPPMMFIKKAPNSHGFVNPRHLEEIWRDQFDWVYREYDYAVFPITIHPDVSGRPQVLLMLERLIDHINGTRGVTWVTFEEIADDFARRKPRQR